MGTDSVLVERKWRTVNGRESSWCLTFPCAVAANRVRRALRFPILRAAVVGEGPEDAWAYRLYLRDDTPVALVGVLVAHAADYYDEAPLEDAIRKLRPVPGWWGLSR